MIISSLIGRIRTQTSQQKKQRALLLLYIYFLLFSKRRLTYYCVMTVIYETVGMRAYGRSIEEERRGTRVVERSVKNDLPDTDTTRWCHNEGQRVIAELNSVIKCCKNASAVPSKRSPRSLSVQQQQAIILTTSKSFFIYPLRLSLKTISCTDFYE